MPHHKVHRDHVSQSRKHSAKKTCTPEEKYPLRPIEADTVLSHHIRLFQPEKEAHCKQIPWGMRSSDTAKPTSLTNRSPESFTVLVSQSTIVIAMSFEPWCLDSALHASNTRRTATRCFVVENKDETTVSRSSPARRLVAGRNCGPNCGARCFMIFWRSTKSAVAIIKMIGVETEEDVRIAGKKLKKKKIRRAEKVYKDRLCFTGPHR